MKPKKVKDAFATSHTGPRSTRVNLLFGLGVDQVDIFDSSWTGSHQPKIPYKRAAAGPSNISSSTYNEQQVKAATQIFTKMKSVTNYQMNFKFNKKIIT